MNTCLENNAKNFSFPKSSVVTGHMINVISNTKTVRFQHKQQHEPFVFLSCKKFNICFFVPSPKWCHYTVKVVCVLKSRLLAPTYKV